MLAELWESGHVSGLALDLFLVFLNNLKHLFFHINGAVGWGWRRDGVTLRLRYFGDITSEAIQKGRL